MSGIALQEDLSRDRRVALSDADAWDAIVGWPAAARFDPLRDGFDFAELTRSFLWDKVGRAIRFQTDPERSRSELAALRDADARRHVPAASVINAIAVTARSALVATRTHLRRRTSVYLPVASPLLRRTAVELHGRGVRILAPRSTDAAYRIAIRSPRPPLPYRADTAFARTITAAIDRGLSALGVTLLDRDAAVLEMQIANQTARLRSLATRLAATPCDALLLHADNHPPFIEYVALAHRAGIPVVMLQHGLDCEERYLDRMYAPYAALWSAARRDRYARSGADSTMRVTGSPEHDQFRLPSVIPPAANTWLWLTRPHAPERCYAPSRWPDEGVAILDALLAAVARHPRATLTIKPHPADPVAAYADRIRRSAASDRVRIANEPVDVVVARSTLVFTEDSTAALETAFLGRALVHTHFAASEPLLPLARLGAALPARDPSELANAVESLLGASPAERITMLEGQRAFVAANAGPCDGEAAMRVADFIAEIAGRRT